MFDLIVVKNGRADYTPRAESWIIHPRIPLAERGLKTKVEVGYCAAGDDH